MDKAAIIFSILTHDYDFMQIFWLFVSLPAGFWHLFSFPSKKQLTEKELVEISPTFKGIDSDYIIFSILGLGLLVLLPTFVFLPEVDHWAELNFGIRFYPSSAVFAVGYGISQGLFALFKGVYPRAKFLLYIYDEEVRIRRVAMYQILIALLTFGIATLFFFVTAR